MARPVTSPTQHRHVTSAADLGSWSALSAIRSGPLGAASQRSPAGRRRPDHGRPARAVTQANPTDRGPRVETVAPPGRPRTAFVFIAEQSRPKIALDLYR